MTREQEFTEREIHRIIEGYRPDQYDDAISDRDSWGLFYHLSSLRGALLSWYPFDPKWHALEVGAGFGALTGVLAENCERVTALETNANRLAACRKRHEKKTNIEYRLGDVGSLPEGEKYDCIVLVDQLEKYRGPKEELLSACAAHLKEDGAVLACFQNRFGIKFLCGGMDARQKEPFGSLPPQSARLFSRREAEACARKAGLGAIRCYYPMPDFAFTQAVYTDSAKEMDSVRDRVFAYEPFGAGRVAVEQALYDDVIHEGLLPELSTSIFMELRKTPGDGKRDVDFAVLSADRGPERGYATVCFRDGTVEKRALWPEGAESLREAFGNLEGLAAKGILTVPQQWAGDRIRMPRIQEEPLLADIRRRMARGGDAVLAVFEELKADILRSSPAVEPDEGRLWRDWRVGRERIGTVLGAGLIDMIPYNAFRAGDRIRYYDQEFRVEHCPADYILFRAVYYTWLHIPELERALPLEEAKKRLGLAENWEAYLARETAFVEENRQRNRFSQMTGWAQRAGDWEAVKRARRRLSGREPSETHRLQKEMLEKLSRVCAEAGLTFFAVHGTLLGAARHAGFIPWDDDVDLAMPRKDYDRLLAMGKEAFGEPFFLQTPDNNNACFYGGYAKLRHSGLMAPDDRSRGRRCHQGVWIDIFPLDDCPAGEKARRRLQKKITFWQRLLFARLYAPGKGLPEDMKPGTVSLYYLAAKCMRRRWIRARLDRLFRSAEPGGGLSILACYYGEKLNRNVYHREDFEGAVMLPFEGMEIPAPAGYERILTDRYGSRYMEVPGPDKRYSHRA